MIAEAAIAGLTVCFVACLRFTQYVIDRTDPFAEKRRILERKREELHGARLSNSPLSCEDRQRAANLLAKVDDELLALTDHKQQL